MNRLWHSFIVMMNETTSGDDKFLFIDELNSALIRNFAGEDSFAEVLFDGSDGYIMAVAMVLVKRHVQ